MNIDTEWVRRIQSKSGTDESYGFLGHLGRQMAGKFSETTIGPHSHFNTPQQQGEDSFFTPLRFYTNVRKTEFASHPGVLFADLDGAPYPFITPTYYWQTSPGNTQAIWYLKGQVEDIREWEHMNQRLTYALGADKGGWSASKLLRVPGTHNFKRDCLVGKAHYRDVEYSFEALDDVLPKLAQHWSVEHTKAPDLPSKVASFEELVKHWPAFGMYTKSLLEASVVSDRSYHVVKAIKSLRKDGLVDTEIFIVIWGRHWNKWRLKQNPDRLWLEIQKR